MVGMQRGVQGQRIARISTRGHYDLRTGMPKDGSAGMGQYRLYPKRYFEDVLKGCDEMVIMVHGMRNGNAGALDKVVLAHDRLREIGYVYPVVGFSYDSNVIGAHIAGQTRRALAIAISIAKKNGPSLARFIGDFVKDSPSTKIRLMGHSLGSQVILSAVRRIARIQQNHDVIDSIDLFGASVHADELSAEKSGEMLQRIVRGRVNNHYAPTDEVLSWADGTQRIGEPLGLYGIRGGGSRPFAKYRQRRVRPENHRFASYIKTLRSFP